MVRRVLLPLLAVGAAAAFAPGAFAANPPCSPVQPQSIASAHFTITYNDDPANSSGDPAITATQAGNVLAGAERAYTAMVAMGFPAPVQSGGTTFIHVVNLTTSHLTSFNCFANIDIDGGTAANPDQIPYATAFDVFSEIEWTYGATDDWLQQGAASWAAWKSLGFPTNSTATLGPWDMSLDCDFGVISSQNCSTDGYTNLGQSRWPFFEFLAEHYGVSFIGTVLTDDNVAPDSVTALQTALATKGATLGGEYNEFAARVVKNGWSVPSLNLVTPPVAGSLIQTGILTADLPSQTLGVDHLATRIVQIDRGDGSAAHPCYAATLKLTVTMPAGVSSQPVFIWKVPGTASVPLNISGNTATASIPWDTCSWTAHGYLALPNASTTENAVLFTVAAHLDVSSTEITAHPPTAPANGYGNATDVGSAEVAPLITVFGPLAMHLPSTATRLRLVVEANAQGAVHATLGTNDLGQSALVPGENVLSFKLPAGVLRRLRTTSAANNLLTLSPLSPDGLVTGTARTLKVVVTPPPAKPKKPKKKKH